MSTAGATFTFTKGQDPKSLIQRLRRFITRSDKDLKDTTRQHANLLLELITSNIMTAGIYETGAYLNSWFVSSDGGSWTVATDHPAALRHEFGFVGTDSLGRHYDEPGRPHIIPALLTLEQLWPLNVNEKVESWWK
jgi:hypothetical protein